MRFRHSEQVWQQFPTLVPGVVSAAGIRVGADVAARVDAVVESYGAVARSRLAAAAGATEAGLPQVQAWRRVFATMGLKPTQYRCAAESLLRRFRRDGELPRLHPLVDVCNAASLAFAIPVAALDVSRIDGDLVVRHATGDETYLAFSAETEHPAPGEVVFADDAGHAHARRWTHRQSAASAVRDTTSVVLLVAEAVHEQAAGDVEELVSALATHLAGVWSVSADTAVLTAAQPVFTVR